MRDLTRLRAARYVHATITPDGGMLLDVRGRGRWLVLPATAAAAWPHLACGAPAAAIEAIRCRWDIPREQAAADVEAFAAGLAARRLLVPARNRRCLR